MLLLSLLFIMVGMSLLISSVIMIIYMLFTSYQKVDFLSYKNWPSIFRKWTLIGAAGFLSILLGMVLAVIAT